MLYPLNQAYRRYAFLIVATRFDDGSLQLIAGAKTRSGAEERIAGWARKAVRWPRRPREVTGHVVVTQAEFQDLLSKQEDKMQSNGLREADKRVIKAFVAERPASSNLLETDGVKLEKIGLGGETVAYWVDGRIAVVSTESAKSDMVIIRAISKEAGPGIVDFSYARKGHRVHTHGASGRSPHAGASQRELEHLETILRRHGYDQADARKLQAEGMGPTELEGRIVHHPGDLERTHGMKRLNRNGHTPNARGVYHGTGVAKNDMVLHQDHHGRWRIDLVTSAGGNHTDVTGRSPSPGSRPNSGYDSAEQAFQAALDVQHTRGIRGKSHVWVQQGDELHDYVPEEARLDDPVPSVLARNGRSSARPVTLTDEEYRQFVAGDGWDIMQSVRATAQDRANRNNTEVSIVAPDGHEIEWCSPQRDLLPRSGKPVMRRTSRDPGRAGMHQYGPATVWVSGPVSGTWWATVKFKNQEKDLDARSYEEVLLAAAEWVDAAPELGGHNANGNPGDPPPKFRIGDRVQRDDGSSSGTVSFIGGYDPFIGGYRYKVQQDGGGRIYWNESSTRHEQLERNGNPEDRGHRWRSDPPGLRAGDEAPAREAAAMVWYFPFGDTPYDIQRGRVATVEIAFASLNRAREFFSEAVASGHLEAAELRKAQPGHARGMLIDEYKAEDNLEPNGRRTGILSDGTRVNVYHQDDVGDPWTVVPHGETWDAQERRGMRQMLSMSETGSGISEWTEGQEGRHLGRSMAWAEVPDNIKRHIERRVAQESNMVANPRKRTTKKSAPVAETREQRIAREWAKAEDAGLVRIQADPEYENYFDVYGEPDSPEERAEQEELIERHGVFHVYSQYKSQDTGDWETADAVGMIFGNDLGDDNPYVLDMKESALQNVFGGHTPNARGSVANEHHVRELSLYIENEYSLVGAPNSRGKAIHENLLRKVKSGKYDKALAPKAWQYLIDDGAKKYTKEYGDGNGFGAFTAADRRQVAEEYARAWEEENLR
jgi:hypothetical protein